MFVVVFPNPPTDFPRRDPEESARFTATDRGTTKMDVLYGYKNGSFPALCFRNKNTL